VRTHSVVFTPEAEEQLAALYRYVAEAASPGVAEKFTSAIITHCEALRTFPEVGILREDIRPGVRITHYKGRTVIAFAVDAKQVSVIGVFYGGQDYETVLQDSD
jgi:toxin ParE1/3/4